MKILKRRSHEEIITHLLCFSHTADPNSGYSFECDSNGVVDEGLLNVDALNNLRQCRDGNVRGHLVDPAEIQTSTRRYTHSAIGECNCCQSEVVLSGFTNTCECGADYNMSGQQLAARSQWGEETGEQWQDCYEGSLED